MRLVKTFIPLYILLAMWSVQTIASGATEWKVDKRVPSYEGGPEKKILGYTWSLGAKKEGGTLVFLLRTNDDMSEGHWFGGFLTKGRVKNLEIWRKGLIRDPVKVKIGEIQAAGPGSEGGRWKNGSPTVPMHNVVFGISFEEIARIKGDTLLHVAYNTIESNEHTEVVYRLMDLQSFELGIEEMVADVRSMEGGTKWVMTQDEVFVIPIKDLPIEIQTSVMDSLKNNEAERLLDKSLDDMKEFTMKELSHEIKKAQHQEIYDMWPDWDDLNICPDGQPEYCKSIGMVAHAKEAGLLESTPWRFGIVTGVVWRSEGAVVNMYAGSVELDIDPELRYATKAGYYYIAQDEGRELHVLSADSVSLTNQ